MLVMGAIHVRKLRPIGVPLRFGGPAGLVSSADRGCEGMGETFVVNCMIWN